MHSRTQLINYLISKKGYTRYLELGLADGQNFIGVNCQQKTGVDVALIPRLKGINGIHETSTDQFFDTLHSEIKEKYDLIFIDADHHDQQFTRDVLNSLKYLSPDGLIVCHDCNPISEERQIEVFKGGAWNGTVWKGWARFRMTRSDLEMSVIDMDEGCGIIRPCQSGSQILYSDPKGPENPEIFTYKYLAQNRKKLLNLISINEFLSKFK